MRLTIRVLFGAKIFVVGFLAIACSSCSHNAVPLLPGDYTATLDSVQLALWRPQIVQHDTMRHTVFYDSLYSKLSPSIELEREKRAWAQDFLSGSPLAAYTLRDSMLRRKTLAALDSFNKKRAAWSERASAIFRSYEDFVTRTVDSAFGTEPERRVLLGSLLREDVVVPEWRLRYDALQAIALSQIRDIVQLIDTAKNSVVIDSSLHFLDPAIADVYRAKRVAIDSLAVKERALAVSAVWRMDTVAATVNNGGKRSLADSSRQEPFHTRGIGY